MRDYVIDHMTDIDIYVFKFNIRNFLGHVHNFFTFFSMYNIYINNTGYIYRYIKFTYLTYIIKYCRQTLLQN